MADRLPFSFELYLERGSARISRPIDFYSHVDRGVIYAVPVTTSRSRYNPSVEGICMTSHYSLVRCVLWKDTRVDLRTRHSAIVSLRPNPITLSCHCYISKALRSLSFQRGSLLFSSVLV